MRSHELDPDGTDAPGPGAPPDALFYLVRQPTRVAPADPDVAVTPPVHPGGGRVTRPPFIALVDDRAAAVVVLDAATSVYLYANAEAGALHGVAAPDQLLGRSALAGLGPEMGQRLGTWLRETCATGQITLNGVDAAVLLGDDRHHLVDVSASFVHWAGRAAVQLELREVPALADELADDQRADQRVRALFELSPVGVMEADASADIVVANRALERMLGYGLGELAGVGLGDVLGEWVSDILAGLQTGWHGQADLRTRTGASVPVLLDAHVIRRPGGGVERVLSTVIDLSELSTAMSVAAGHDRDLTASLHLAGVGSWSEDLTTGEMEWSAGMRSLLGVPDGVPATRDLLLSLLDPTDRAGLAALLEPADTAPTGPVDVAVRRWDGTDRVFELRAERDPTAGTSRCLGTIQDVTDLRHQTQALEASEYQARQLLQALPDAVIITDTDGRIAGVNGQAETLFGYRSDELVGRPVEVLLPVESHEAHRRLRRSYLAAPPPGVLKMGPGLVARHRDGSPVPVEVNLGTIDLATGTAVVATVRDVTEARNLQSDLSAARDLFSGVLQAATEQSVIAIDNAGTITVFNAGAERMLGYREADMVGRSIIDLHDPEELLARADELGVSPGLAPLVSAPRFGQPETREWTYVTADGRRVTVSLAMSAMTDGDGGVIGFIGVANDVTDRRRSETALRNSEVRFRMAFDDAPIGMALVGLDGAEAGRFLRINRAMCTMTGHDEAELLGREFTLLAHPVEAPETAAALGRLGSGGQERWEADRRLRTVGGDDLWVHLSASVVPADDGATSYAVFQIEDITARKLAETQLTHQALHDALTGLPNRTLLLDHLDQALHRVARSERHVAVLFFDLDDFKVINDSLGHEAGDEFLVQVADRLRACLRDTDTPSRFGGDEFVVCCEDLHDMDEAEMVAARLDRALRTDVELRGRSVSLSASIGVAISSSGSTPESMLREADAAMYRAKELGKGRYEMADADLRNRALRQITMEAGLHRALERGELMLDYQPCFDLGSDRIVAVEALLRWRHPDHGVLGPDAFLDVAEDRDLIVPIGAWVIGEACRQAALWRNRFGGDGTPQMWVNVSSRQLGKHQLTRVVTESLDRSGLPATGLCLELTERQLIGAAHSVRSDLDALPALGVVLAIDDFGTGHNGMEYLRDIPVGALKIDRSFVGGLGTDRTDTALTASVVSLGHSLDLTVIAEGVETVEQQGLLRELGCDIAQGFLLGRPTTPAGIEALLVD